MIPITRAEPRNVLLAQSKFLSLVVLLLVTLGGLSTAECEGKTSFDGTTWKLFCFHACDVGGCSISEQDLGGGVSYKTCVCNGGPETNCCHTILLTVGGVTSTGKRGTCGTTGCDAGICEVRNLSQEPLQQEASCH